MFPTVRERERGEEEEEEEESFHSCPISKGHQESHWLGTGLVVLDDYEIIFLSGDSLNGDSCNCFIVSHKAMCAESVSCFLSLLGSIFCYLLHIVT